MFQIAFNYMNTHGADREGRPLGRYFIHGLGHHIGLDVHDAGDPDRPLEAGMVVTDEPGLYLPEEKIGVRIEDDVLITPTGYKLLTARLPRTVAEIEALMASPVQADPVTRPAPEGPRGRARLRRRPRHRPCGRHRCRRNLRCRWGRHRQLPGSERWFAAASCRISAI